ncbi:TPA: hypothetical protein N0F65_011717 [Lagenidium giganteum]|uniref:Uncharacterized protein n=1 Tax=Lagenidium giganteum TaxID=4803 RepID=A0AAV2YG28_9STRA|nr:TPA: hypothetical protein N0F65_011717 [Lagenidium giganteum]
MAASPTSSSTLTNVQAKHLDQQHNVGTKIVLGGVANIVAASITNPIDVVKIRLQLQSVVAQTESGVVADALRYHGFRHGLRAILKEEGVAGWYKGIQASLFREGSYSALRFGLYDVFKERYDEWLLPKAPDGQPLAVSTPLHIKILSGATSGAVGSALANPMDLVKVRMQGDRSGLRYNNSFLFACRDIYQHDGVIKGFYRGVGPTTLRAMVLTATQLASYDHMKAVLVDATPLEEGFAVHIIASMFAGLMAATTSSPIDVIKTKIMNECSKTTASHEYFNSSQLMRRAVIDVLRTDGVRGFFKGWFPNWIRLGPHTIISLMVYEELRALMGIKPV